MLKRYLVTALLLFSLCKATNYIGYLNCMQANCFSLSVYCQNDAKCFRSFQLVNLCSSINPTMVSTCIANIHNYLHISYQTCLSSSCGYNEYFANCGMNYFQIDQCLNDITSTCYLNQGQYFMGQVLKCVNDQYPANCAQTQKYPEYDARCTKQTTYACQQSVLATLGPGDLKTLFECSLSQILRFYKWIGFAIILTFLMY